MQTDNNELPKAIEELTPEQREELRRLVYDLVKDAMDSYKPAPAVAIEQMKKDFDNYLFSTFEGLQSLDGWRHKS